MAIRAISIGAAANEYLFHIEARGLDASTIRSKAMTLRQFAEDLGDCDVRELTPAHIDRWRSAHAWAASTANLRVSHIRGFLKWCSSRGYLPLSADPLYGYRSQRVPRKPRLRIPQRDWAGLLDSAPHPLERALLACGLYLMCRISELTSIRLRDVDLAAGEITVYRHKTDRTSVLPVCLELDTELRRWLTWYGLRHDLHPDAYLLPRRARGTTLRDGTGRLLPLSQEHLLDPQRPMGRAARNIQRVLKDCGYAAHREGGHTLRRSAARAYYDELVAKGHDGALRQVQTMLDHTASATTELYLGTDRDKAELHRSLRGRRMFEPTEETNVVRLHG